ncbi:MAG: lipopolysaccharide biosynthesis protein [Rhodothermaceae bacterium]|nr:lipopolysaccharide biosynthesis protein [Rhodothermaceae bacterium]
MNSRSSLRGWLHTRTSGAFIQPVLTLVSGAALGQAVVFAARPMLTRLFTPEEFGVLTLFVALTGLLGTVAGGRYDDALMLPDDHQDSATILGLSLGLALITSLVLALALPWREAGTTLLGSPLLAPALVLLPLTVLGVAWGSALETWHTRFDRFAVVSTGRVAQSAVVVGVQLTAGALGASALGLVGGVTAGFGVLALSLLSVALLRDRAHLHWPSLVSLRAHARRHQRFPTFSAPAAFLNLLSKFIPAFLLAPFYGMATVGLYGQAYGALALPVGMVAGAVSQVFFVRAAEAHRDDTLGPLTRMVHRRLVAVTLFPMAAAALAGPELFAFVFGAPWREAGVFAQLLAPWLFVATLAMPLTRVFDVTEQQRADFAFSVLLFGVQALTLASVYLAGGSARLAIGAVSVAGTLSRVTQVAWMLRLAGTSRRRAAKDLLRHLGYAVPGLLPAVAVMVLTHSPLLLLLAFGLGAVGYLLLAARADRRFSDPSA